MTDEPKLIEAQLAAIDGWLRLNHGPDQIATNVAEWLAAAEKTARAEAWAQGHARACSRGPGLGECPLHVNPYRDVGCGNCGQPLLGEAGYSGAAAYHRACAVEVYGDEFEATP